MCRAAGHSEDTTFPVAVAVAVAVVVVAEWPACNFIHFSA